MECDVAVIGAGPAGLAFARGLAGSGLSVTMAERSPESTLADPPFDGREIALTHRSQAIMRELDAFGRIPAEAMSPLREARVLDGASPLALSFTPGTRDGTPLGLLTPNHLIRRALFDSVREAGCATILAGTAVERVETAPRGGTLRLSDGRDIRARLVVAADTRFSEARAQMGIAVTRRDFGTALLVARVTQEKPHGGVATEWFGRGQTVAMLPLRGDASSLVLTLDPTRIAALMTAPEDDFNAEVTRRTASRWGALRLASTRHSYPLIATYARRFAGMRFALVGDAAVGMNPVTAHGFNFGLAGAHRLARELRETLARGRDVADPRALLRYEMAHRRATFPLFTATNAIATLYSDDRAAARVLRGAVLRAGAALSPVRRLIAAQLMEARPV